MPEAGHRLGFAAEPVEHVEVGEYAAGDHLEGDVPVERDASGQVDDAHPAVAEPTDDLEAGDRWESDGVRLGRRVNTRWRLFADSLQLPGGVSCDTRVLWRTGWHRPGQ